MAKAISRGTNIDPQNLAEFVTEHLVGRIDEIIASPEFVETSLAERLAEAGLLPMYGMPSRLRALYYELEDGNNNPRARSIDRDLELAITEFSPDARPTFEKSTLAPNGLVGQPRHVMGRNGGFWTAGEPIPYRRYQFYCPDCGTLEEWGDGQVPADNSAVSAACGHCGSQNSRLMECVVPAAFRASKDKEDAPEGDRAGTRGRSYLAVVRSDAAAWTPIKDTALEMQLRRGGRVMRINDGGGRGHYFQERQQLTQNGVPGAEPFAGSSNTEIFLRCAIQWASVTDGGRRFALVAPRTTDVLTLRRSTPIAGLNLNPASGRIAVRAAYYSAATMLVRALSMSLDIDPIEIDLAGIHGGEPNDPSAVGSITLADNLPNGSGFVEQLQNLLPSMWDELLAVDYCTCGSACLKCLLNYRNRPLHGLLDRHLGRRLLEIFRNPNNDPIANIKNGDVERWERLRDGFVAAFNGQVAAQRINALPGFTVDAQSYVVADPFWSHIAPAGSPLARAVGNSNVRLVDAFNLELRPAWCFTHLGNFPAIILWGGQAAPAAVPAAPRMVHPIVIPAELNFTVDQPIEGMPPIAQPPFTFHKVADTDAISAGKVYLYQTPDDQYRAGGLARRVVAGTEYLLPVGGGAHLERTKVVAVLQSYSRRGIPTCLQE